jgi:DHA3 family macrolide efflux protein-like MFS transporter
MSLLTIAGELKVFIYIWFGQMISQIGSGLTGFALGIWVYQKTESVTLFALISLCTSLPGIIISPLAGAIVDRWERRTIMIASDCSAGISTLLVALLLVSGQLQVWQIYLATCVISTCATFQWLAYSAVTSFLVPQQHLARTSAMVQLAEAVSRILAPGLAGLLIAAIEIQGVILVDFTTYLLALVTLIGVRFPADRTTDKTEADKQQWWREALTGWTYIQKRPGLLGLLLLFAACNFSIGVVSILITPMVLAFASPTALGTVLSVGGSGMLVGSMVMSVWGGSRQLIYNLLGFGLLQGICIIVAGLRPTLALIALAAFGGFFCYPIISSCSQAIWQRQVPLELQGRVFAVRRAIALSMMPLAYLLAGWLADGIFEPLLTQDGLLANTAGTVIGVGAGRGIGLLFCVLGMFSILVNVGGYFYPRLRLVESELPE